MPNGGDPRYTASLETLQTLEIEPRDANLAAREKFGDWRLILDRFAALAESAA